MLKDELVVWKSREAGGTLVSTTELNKYRNALVATDLTDPTSAMSKAIANAKSNSIRLSSYAKGDFNYATNTGTKNQDLTAAATAAAARGAALLIDDGVYHGSMNIVDLPLIIDPASTGYIAIPRGASAVSIKHNIGARIAVTSIATGWARANDSGSPWQEYPQITISAANMAATNPQQGDKYLINSADIIAGDFIGDGENTFQQEWFSVMGVGMDVTHASTDTTSTGRLAQGQFVTGSVSTATGWVSALATLTGSQLSVTLTGVKGVFQAGENLVADGIVRGAVSTRAPYIVAAEQFVHTYTTAVEIRKGQQIPVDLTGLRVMASEDTDAFILAANRFPAIQLTTTIGSRGHVHAKSTMKSLIAASSIYGFNFYLDIEKMPGQAEDKEGAWGYGFMAMGSCERGLVRGRATNGRHFFTTNIRPTVSRLFTDDYVATNGVAKYIEAGGYFHNFTDAALDTHGGSMFITFKDFHITGSGAYGRTQARAAAVQNRSFGGVVMNGVIENTVDGIREVSTTWPQPFPSVTLYKNITMRNIRRYGWNAEVSAEGDQTKGTSIVHIQDCDVRFRLGADNPNEQYAVNATFGAFEIDNLSSHGSKNGFIKAGALDSLVVSNSLIDHSPHGAASVPNLSNIELTSTTPIPLLVLDRVRVRPKVNGAVGTQALLSVTAPGQTVYTDGCGAISASSTLPFFSIVGTGTLSITSIKDTGSTLNAQIAWVPGDINAGSIVTTTATVTGANTGDYADVTTVDTLPANITILPGRVSATNTVTMTMLNTSAGSATDATVGRVNVPSKTMRIRVRK